MKCARLMVAVVGLAVCFDASASITEIRKNFFNRTIDLPATAIMAAPAVDASYLIGIYESTKSCTVVPVLRWTDENGAARSQQGVVSSAGGSCYVSLVANIRVRAITKPTIETSGDDDHSTYSLYVSGLGFWTTGSQKQGGLSEATGTLPTKSIVYALSVYKPPSSTTGLLVAYSTGYAGRDIPYVSWTDEYNNHTQDVPVGTSAVLPVRISGGTSVWVHTFPGDNTWYGLIVFGAPAKGAGPFTDYEANLLDWTSASYPNLQTLFTAGSAGANVLLLSNVAQQPNNGASSEAVQLSWPHEAVAPCASSPTAGPSGAPATCMSCEFIGAGTPVQFRTYNTPGSPWGAAPAYSLEVDALQF